MRDPQIDATVFSVAVRSTVTRGLAATSMPLSGNGSAGLSFLPTGCVSKHKWWIGSDAPLTVRVDWKLLEGNNNLWDSITRQLLLEIGFDVFAKRPKSSEATWKVLAARLVVFFLILLEPRWPFLHVRHDITDQRLLLILVSSNHGKVVQDHGMIRQVLVNLAELDPEPSDLFTPVGQLRPLQRIITRKRTDLIICPSHALDVPSLGIPTKIPAAVHAVPGTLVELPPGLPGRVFCLFVEFYPLRIVDEPVVDKLPG